MKTVTCKPEDGLELLTRLELTKFLEQRRTQGNEISVEDMHRTFHFYVVRWLTEHGFEVVRK